MNHFRHQKHKNKQSNNTWVLKVKNSPSEFEKDFKPINISTNDVDKFGNENTSKEENICIKYVTLLLRFVN